MGISIVIHDIPVTVIFDQLTLMHLNIQQQVSICTSSFRISLDIHISDGKHPVAIKCTHILLPLVILLTLTNRSVRCDTCTIHEISKNGKQYLNIALFLKKVIRECPGHDFCMSRYAVHYV